MDDILGKGVLPDDFNAALAYLKKCTYEELNNLLDKANRRRIQLQIRRRGKYNRCVWALERDSELISKAMITGDYKGFKTIDTPIVFTWSTKVAPNNNLMIFENLKIYRSRDYKYNVSYGKSREIEHHPVSVYCKTFRNIKKAFKELIKLGNQLAPQHIQEEIQEVCRNHNIKIK
jgi:hypothetical protein